MQAYGLHVTWARPISPGLLRSTQVAQQGAIMDCSQSCTQLRCATRVTLARSAPPSAGQTYRPCRHCNQTDLKFGPNLSLPCAITTSTRASRRHSALLAGGRRMQWRACACEMLAVPQPACTSSQRTLCLQVHSLPLAAAASGSLPADADAAVHRQPVRMCNAQCMLAASLPLTCCCTQDQDGQAVGVRAVG